MGDETESGRMKRTRHVSSKMAQFLQETVKRKSGVSRYMGDSASGEEKVEKMVVVVDEFPENPANERKGKRKLKNGRRAQSKEAKDGSTEAESEESKKRRPEEIRDELMDAIREEARKSRSKKIKEELIDAVNEDSQKRPSKNKSPGLGRKSQVPSTTTEEDHETSLTHVRAGSSTDDDSLTQPSSVPVIETEVQNPDVSVAENHVEPPDTSEAQPVPRYYNDAHNTLRPPEPRKMRVVRPIVKHAFIPSSFHSRKRSHVSSVPFQKIPKVVVPIQPRSGSASDQENRVQNSTTSEAQPPPRYYNDVHNLCPPREPQQLNVIKPIVRHILAPYKLPTSKKKIQVSSAPLQKIQKAIPLQSRPESASDQENWIKPHPPEIQPILLYYNDVHNMFPPVERNYRYFYVTKDGSEFIYQPLQVHRTETRNLEMICPPEELSPQSPDTSDAVDQVVEVNPGVFLTVL